MLTAVLLVLGALAGWLLADRLLLRRNERLHQGHAAWTQRNRTFHSTGWEETVPPMEVNDQRIEPRGRRSEDRAAA